MSLNTVIIAIVVLIVLVVLVMIFTGYFGKIFTPTVGNCATQGGTCAGQCNTETVGSEIVNAKGCPGQKCCAIVQSIAEVGTPAPVGDLGVQPASGAPAVPKTPSGGRCTTSSQCISNTCTTNGICA